jgi:hypothetical protein
MSTVAGGGADMLRVTLGMNLPALYQAALPARRVHLDAPVDGGGDGPGSQDAGQGGPAPAFMLDDIAFLPLGVQATDDGDWYVQCVRYSDGYASCFKIVPAEALRGLALTTAISGGYPVVFFTQTARPDAASAERQSLMMSSFTQRYRQVVADIRAYATASRARAPRGSTSASTDADGGSLDPDPGMGDGGTVIIPGTPEFEPVPIFIPTYEPVPYEPPPPPAPEQAPGDPPSTPDGSTELKSTSQTCVAMPGPGGAPVGACVVVIPPKGQPLEDPDSLPTPPPAWDWCHNSIICNGATNFPAPDPRQAAGDSKYVIDTAICIRDRALGRIDKDKYEQCLVLKAADRTRCRAALGQQVTAGGAG